jgi:two-component system CheB/CheR fusion protein
MIWVAASNRNASFFNNTWLTYTGRSLDQEAGNGWMENVHPEDLAQFLVIYDKSFTEQAPYQVEYRLKRHDGEYRWMLNIGRPSFSPEGVFTGFIGTCTEIHEKHLINAELEKNVEQRTHDLKELNKELERSNKELEQFAYIASHDLQEPLRKIITFADSLKLLKEGLSEKGISYINKITNASERMNKLIDDLLNFSRISRTHGIFTRTDLDAILKDVLVDFDLSISQKKAKIRSDTLQVIEANPVEMKQLFHNLIGNALKFSKKNIPPEITISSHKLTEEEVKRLIKNRRPVPYVAIVFKDNGIGFNPEYCEQVFDIFQRLNANHEYPGTGIGLALCRRIVNNHGGEIYADSKENEGATFHVILPLEQPQEENL